MSAKKTIAVVGATGAQGGGLVRAILGDPGSQFHVRAVTRNPRAEAAQALAAMGAEVVAGDVESEESLREGFRGCHAAYLVTFFWAHFSPEKELAHAQNMARAAKAAGVEHVVWSTLEDTRRWVPLDDDRMPTLMGRYKVPHFDAKGEADEYFRQLGVPTTFFLTSFYWDNLIHFGMAPKKDAEGRLTFTLPMGEAKLAGIAAEDIGRCAHGIFQKGHDYIGKTVGVAGDHLTGGEMAAELSSALGREVRYQAIPVDVYRGLGFPGAEDLGNMFQFYEEFGDYFCKSRDLSVSRSLNPRLQSFRAWVQQNKERIPIE